MITQCSDAAKPPEVVGKYGVEMMMEITQRVCSVQSVWEVSCFAYPLRAQTTTPAQISNDSGFYGYNDENHPQHVSISTLAFLLALNGWESSCSSNTDHRPIRVPPVLTMDMESQQPKERDNNLSLLCWGQRLQGFQKRWGLLVEIRFLEVRWVRH